MEEDDEFTRDGTVDLHGRPVPYSTTGKWKACAFLVAYESFERMAFYGIASNLVVYLTTQFHEDTVSSVRNVNNWTGSAWMTPILGAYIADSYLGRFWTFTVASSIYVLGMVMITLGVSLRSLRSPPSCSQGVCSKATPLQVGYFYCALYIIALGAGGTKPNISTFGADQFDDFNPRESKLKVSFFNWWMFSAFTGGLFANLGLVYIQENLGWGWGYGIPTTGLVVSLLFFYLGTPLYRHKPVKDSPCNDLVRVVVAAFERRKLRLPDDPKELHELKYEDYVMSRKRRMPHTSSFRFLDRSAIRESVEDRKVCTTTEVEEAKMVLRMTIVWLVLLIPSAIWAQGNTLFVKQGTTMNRNLGGRFEIPAASLNGIITLAMLISVPIYDKCFIPYFRQKTGNPRGITLLQRLGIGISLQLVVMVVAYVVEIRRMQVIKSSGSTRPGDVVPMSILWLLPQYALLGIADVFNAIGLLEFFYDQSPEGMQSLGTTFFTSGIGVGNFLNSFLVTLVDDITSRGGKKSWLAKNLNDSHLDHYYAFLAVILVVNLVVFLWVACKYKYKKEVCDFIENKGKNLHEVEDKVSIVHPVQDK